LRQVAAGRHRLPALVTALTQAVTSGPRAQAWDTFQPDDPVPFGVETLAWLRQ
jgi:hypothetical protein